MNAYMVRLLQMYATLEDQAMREQLRALEELPETRDCPEEERLDD